ncbi:MAG TPA: aspartate dehydrogenase domain-containing protein [Candidatus Nanoarchaeia archaeon]|nr:aspartate dehydrogenase domain-containing protein [Candidatus Nanoarchaeia archaeon]
MKIGVIGCGAIGSVLCKFIDAELSEHALIAICDVDTKKAAQVRDSLASKPNVVDMDTLISESDIVIEAVGTFIVKDILLKCIKQEKHLMVMSVGGLIQNSDLLPKLTKRLFVPSGAICGIDGVKAAAIEDISSVCITSTKSPKSLEGAPYIIRNKIDIRNIKGKKTIFEGNALDAINGFPENVNVAAVLSLAGIGAEKTKVKVVVDASIKRNMHEIEVEGSFGKLYTKTENVVSPLNPKTSHMAVLSACATLKRLTGLLKIGN